MTAEDKSEIGYVPLDGNDETLVSKTVPGGELWYVDSITARINNANGNSGIAVDILVDEHRVIYNSVDTNNLNNGTGTVEGTTGVGVYAPAGTEINIEQRDAGGDYTAYIVAIRRVL